MLGRPPPFLLSGCFSQDHQYPVLGSGVVSAGRKTIVDYSRLLFFFTASHKGSISESHRCFYECISDKDCIDYADLDC